MKSKGYRSSYCLVALFIYLSNLNFVDIKSFDLLKEVLELECIVSKVTQFDCFI